MDRVLERTPEGTSPRTFALNHLRPKSSFQGCSRIADYELQGKLGEGTFGCVPVSFPSESAGPSLRFLDC